MENNKEKISSTQLKSEIIKLMDGMIAFPKAYPKFNFPKTSENFANSTSKCKITKCFCKSTPLVLRNSISFLVSH